MFIEKATKVKMLLESLTTRYRIGGFLVGDQVKILDSLTKQKEFKSLSKSVKELVEKMIQAEKDGEAVLKIIAINQSPWIQGTPEPTPPSFDIGIEEGGNFYTTKVSLPGNLISHIERISDDLNMPEMIPAKRKFYHHQNPEPAKVDTDPKKAGWTKSAVIPQ